jgi:hypothetical protein
MSELRERFLVIVFTWSTPKVAAMNSLFDAALDWLKVNDGTWILWTNTNPSEWLAYIKAKMDTDDSVIIAELNLDSVNENYSGWHKKMIWDWIDKHRT